MVLADSHTLSKSIDNDEKVDDIFESINDVDRPTIPKTRKDRQHKYKLYCSKDNGVLQGIKTTKPYSEVKKATDKITAKPTPKPTPKPTTENAKQHKSPKRRVSCFWKKLRGKDKKKETEKHDSKDRRSNHKKKSHTIAYLTTKPDPGKTESKKKHRKKLHLRQSEHKISKRDASGLFSTRPYSNTPQSYKLKMGIAPQVDNMLKSKKIKIKPVQPHTVTVAETPEVSNSFETQLERINSNLSKLKERYGLMGHIARPASDNNPSATSTQGNIMTTESKFQGTAQIDHMLRAMKVKVVSMMYFQTSLVTERSIGATEATIDSNQRTPVSGFKNEIANGEKRTVSITGTYALNPKDSSINANTESHYLVARSIKEDAMTIAMNVEDMIQRELKSLYDKVKHKVSNDFRKEVHTAKATLKESCEKLSSRHTGKASNTTKPNCPSSSTNPPKHKSPLKSTLKMKVVQSEMPARTSIYKTTTTAPRVKKKDEREEVRVEDSIFTPEAYSKQTYDDYVMLTLYEQMLSKTHENDARKLLVTPEFAIYAKNKREARRLSKRNPETLTDVKLTEVVRNIYDDGGNMPDYDYIDPAANVSATGESTASGNRYNDDNYVIDDSSGSADYSSQGSKPLQSKPSPVTSPVPKEACNANNYARGSDNSATVAYNTVISGNPASDTKFEGLSKKISYNQFVDGYKHYLKFQQELKNENFSNLVKYQAHRHHSVDDIGKYILDKIPPLNTFNRSTRNQRFSDDSNNNMDYQEITSKSDDSWFKKHFYLFIDNGPPKKYHTSETVELKPGSVDLKLYFTDTTPTTREDFIRIDSQSIPRKTKNIQEISLNDLSKILDSIKFQETNNPLTKATPPQKQKEDTYTYNATHGATMQDSSLIGKFLNGKRRHASKKRPVTIVYFPATNYMDADNQHGRFKRSNTKESFENTIMADFMNKDVTEEKAAITGTKGAFADAAQTSNRETNKYGYVDIDLVPRQTAVVKLRDNTKKSRIKNFFNKFHFKKNKTKKSKPKRFADYNNYNYYSPSSRIVRFNPIKKLKNIFKNKERKEKKKEPVALSPFFDDYEVNNEDIATLHHMEQPKFEKPVIEVAEMQKQIPNITDTYTEPIVNIKHTTPEKVAHPYKLDDRDQALLHNNHFESSSTKPVESSSTVSPSRTTSAKRIKITEPVDTTAKEAPVTIVSPPSSTITTTPKLQKVPPSNVMTVHIKNMKPTKSKTSLKATEISSPITIDDMSVILKQMHKKLKTSLEYDLTTTTKYDLDFYPTITTMYDPDSSFNLQIDHDYKKNVPSPLPLPQELSIKSKLTRYVKFPIRQRRYKIRSGDDSEPDDIKRENLHDLGSRSTDPSEKRKTAVNTSKKVHPHSYKPNKKENSLYIDYFNDLLMWNNDILNLDSVPNPLWLNILKTLQTDNADGYTTPDMKNLMIEWNEMNDFLRKKVNNSAVTLPTGSTGVKAKDHVRALENQLDDVGEGEIRSVAMDDNAVVTSKDILIKGEAKYFLYNKPKPSDARDSSNFVRKLINLHKIGDDKKKEKVKTKRTVSDPRRESLTPADIPAVTPIIMDTTFIAYDDDVDSLTKELEVKKSCKDPRRRSLTAAVTPIIMDIAYDVDVDSLAKELEVKKSCKDPGRKSLTPADIPAGTPIIMDIAYDDDVDSLAKELEVKKSCKAKSFKRSAKNTPPVAKTEHNSVLKTNKVPVQYYTTPLPMKPQDFHKFLKDYQMDVEFVTAPLPELQPILSHSSSTNKKYNKGSKQNGKTLASIAHPATNLNNLNTKFTTSETETESTTARSKSNQLSLKTAVLSSKLENITKNEGKIAKSTTEQVKRNPKVVINKIITNKKSYWSENFDRYKRFNALKPTNVATLNNRTTHEPKYYNRFKKKMKRKLFEKKVTVQVLTDRLVTEDITVDPRNKEVEITIINFDDLDKMSTPQHFNTFGLAKKDELRPFTDFIDNLVTPYTTHKSKMKTTTDKVDMHNELLYKDIFNEETTITAPTREYSNTDLTKKTQYVDTVQPVKDGQIVTCNNKLRYSFDKAPVYPNIFNKMQRRKNLNNPKRVHISSHHFKYDIFYDDVKKIGKNREVEGLPLKLSSVSSPTMKLSPATSTTMKHSRKLAPTIWGTDAPHTKRKYFTFRGCKPKSTGGLIEPAAYFEEPVRRCKPKSAGGLTEPAAYFEEPAQRCKPKSTGGLTKPTAYFEKPARRCKPKSTGGLTKPRTYFKKPVLTSTPANSFDVSIPKLEENFTASVENTDTISLARSIISVTDIEDLVTMLDIQDSEDCDSDIDSEVTLAVIETEFLTGITVRDRVRRSLVPAEATTANVTMATPVTTTTPVTTAATVSTTTASAPVPSSPLPKNTTSSNKSSKHKEKRLGPQSDRHRRLFKFSDLQHRLKGYIKNFTMTTKRANVTKAEKAMTHSITTSTSTTKPATVKIYKKATRMERAEITEDISDEKEGFAITLNWPESLESPEPLGSPITTTPTFEPSITMPHYYKEDHRHYGTHVPASVHKKPLPEGREEVYVEPKNYQPGPLESPEPLGLPITISPTSEPSIKMPHHYEEEEPTEGTQEHPLTTPPQDHQHYGTHVPGSVHNKPLPEGREEVYVEPKNYQLYDDTAMSLPPSTLTPCEETEPAPHSDLKREVKPSTFTAKDVAALEVIVDLMQNTINYEEKTVLNRFHCNDCTNQHFATTRATNPNCSSTNAIQVHIAIPFDFESGKKRSLSSVPGPVRVRKVFAAKMSTPVDLEYQVNSIEGTVMPTSTKSSYAETSTSNTYSFIDVCSSSSTDAGSLTPGMYLLVDKPKDGFALKPLLGKINLSYSKTRSLPSETTDSMTEAKPTDSRDETTSLKNLAKVTLSKDFVALINQHLLKIYGNRPRDSKDVDSNNTRLARSVWFRKVKEKKKRRKKRAQKYIVKRRIDWDAVKAYFGHDRVCNCKCKSNTAMCRACAASDAVIDELIFEFDNIGRYMADHCTEIQTFFWMNPIGGQKLKDSVSKIDRSLSDYCKRVKGKCQGRLCKTFSTYIDKRNFIKMAKIKNVEDTSSLLNNLVTLAHDLNMTLALNACYNDKLKENGEKFINLMNNCINNKSLSKRSNPTTSPRQMVKQVYSLDNINVNIICNPETPSTADEQMMAATIAPQARSQEINESTNDYLLHFDLEENKHKKRKGFFHLFPRKNKKLKLLPYFDLNNKVKRQVDNQASIPLISDGGGAFWYDYLKAGTEYEPRLARKGRLRQKLEKLGSITDTPTVTVDVVERAVTAGDVLKVTATAENNDLGINTIYKIVHTSPERNLREIETTTDSLSQNINKMLQLFGSLQEVEAMNNNTNSNPTTNLPTRDTSIHRKISQDIIYLVHKVKQKVDKTLAKNLTKSTTTLNIIKNRKATIEHTMEAVTQLAETTNAMSDGSSDNVVVTSSMTLCNITANTQTTNNNSTTVRLAAKSTASNNTAISTTVAIKSIAPKGNKKSQSTSVVNETKTKFGFKNMFKAASVMFEKEQTQTKQTPKKTTKISITTELNTELTPMQTGSIDVVTSNLYNDYVIDENTQNTTENPTILIINDYDTQVSNGSLSDDIKENYKHLLLSIIQFETNNLNNEWYRIAYGGGRNNRDETDLKRNAPKTPKVETEPSIIWKPSSTPKAAHSKGDTHEPDKATMSPHSLLKEIAKKIGIKIVKPKKVVKKPSVREPRRNGMRANFIRNRKIKMNTSKQETPAPVINKEACHTRRTTQPAQICDIQATFKHIQNLQTSLPPKIFENLMKNLSCYKYRNADASFIIPYKKRRMTWDWIRNKRSLKHFHNKIKDDHNFDDETYVVGFEDDSTDIFERFVKGDNGIYKIVQRNKRKVNLEALERGLRNIPTLMPTEDELYVMVGDSVTLDCGINTPVRTCGGKFHWNTDRRGMLEQDNVEVDGLTVAIHNVEPKNSGTYTCSLDHTVRKNVMLSVLTVPSFDIVFLPVYKTEDNCSYDDLIAIQQLGSLMANETHCGKACSVRIDEPVCQRDRSTNNTILRATAVISMTARPVNCSLQCKRDIVSSLVMLSAANAAVLSSIRVEVSREGICETLTPWKACVRPVVTHTLRKKDTNGHREYHHLSSLMSPGKVNVVVICPAGYYLVNKYKLCFSCPPNTSSKAGDNNCRSCPRGTHAEPGAAACHVINTLHHRRYDWWWYPPCGYVVACCGVLFGCTACVLLSVIVHVVSRDAELPEHGGDDEEHNIHKPMPSVTVAYAHFPGSRPLSPSRVILPRFFRPSLTSSRATDSQETKFELWKERNRPPPLPPIDFDP